MTMQIQLNRQMLSAWRTLPPEARHFVESLKVNPRPQGALRIEGRPNYYEEFIAGVWVGWSVNDAGGETIVIVGIVVETGE